MVCRLTYDPLLTIPVCVWDLDSVNCVADFVGPLHSSSTASSPHNPPTVLMEEQKRSEMDPEVMAATQRLLDNPKRYDGYGRISPKTPRKSGLSSPTAPALKVRQAPS